MDPEEIRNHISSLINALRTGTQESFEYSEPLAVGGPTGQYICRAPFIGDCEFMVDVASAGASISQIIVSSIKHTTIIDYSSASQPYSELGAFDGLILSIPANTTVPVSSQWYSVRDSSNSVFINVSAITNSAFVNICFRQKRG